MEYVDKANARYSAASTDQEKSSPKTGCMVHSSLCMNIFEHSSRANAFDKIVE